MTKRLPPVMENVPNQRRRCSSYSGVFCLFWSRSRQWRRIPQVLHISGCICRFALGGIRKNKKRTKTLYQGLSLFMAEKEGFEPSRQLSHPTPLAGEPLRPLGYFSMLSELAEREGFEPPVPCDITGFQDQRLKPLGHLS